MEKFRLKQFCCCCSLKTGCLIIGHLGWVSKKFVYIYFFLLNITFSLQIGSICNFINALNALSIESEDSYATRNSSYVGLGLAILYFFISISLVVGTYKVIFFIDNLKIIIREQILFNLFFLQENQKYILPFLCLHFISVILVYLLTLFLFVYMFIGGSFFIAIFVIIALVACKLNE